MFGKYDAYDLVAEWNRADLPEIFKNKKENKEWGCEFYDIALLYSLDIPDDKITEYVRIKAEHGIFAPFLIQDWKRNIGIAIACDDKNNRSLRYPLKITKIKKKIAYDKLFPSLSTQ